MKKVILLVICFVIVFTGYGFAENDYVGKIEKLDYEDGHGVTFDIAVYDENGIEVFRQGRGESPGSRTAEELKQYIEDLRETMTQNAYAFVESGKKLILDYKAEMENSSSKCNKFVPPKERKIK